MMEGERGYEASNRRKVFFPSMGHTKGDVVDYYRRVAPVMLRHLRGRPLTLERFPDGIGEPGFVQKHAPGYAPSWIARSRQAAAEGPVDYVLAEDERDLAYLADQGTLTFHVWLSRRSTPRQPDRLVFDLDPPGEEPSEAAFGEVRFAARALRDRLEAAGMIPLLMTTGSRGLHVVTPLVPDLDVDEVRRRARRLAERLVADHPERLTVASRKRDRAGRVFLDVLRNAYAQTVVAPYSLRPKPGGPVATPIDWDELERGVGPRSYTLDNLFRRLGQKDDPWAAIDEVARPLTLP